MSEVQITHLDDEKSKELANDFKGQVSGWVLAGDKKWMFPAKYEKLSSIYYNFKVKPDDTWIVTVPRSGTTWTQEMLWLLNNDMNFSIAKFVPIEKRFPFLDFSLAVTDSVLETAIKDDKSTVNIKLTAEIIKQSHEIAENMPSPRFIKTHLPLSLVPDLLELKSKVVYVARNPKDVCVSYYYFCKANRAFDYQGDFERFWNYFENNLLAWTPYWEHLKEAWAERDNPNLLFLFYEELHYDIIAGIKKVAAFLGKSYSDEEYEQLADHLNIDNFRKNKMVNYSQSESDTKVFFKKDNYIREGKAQAWRAMFTPELNERANRWIEENLKDTDLVFPHIDVYS